jgi:predicted ATPase
MITKWTVSNFKSIAKETPLLLAPLTLFAGPNSSGKSTVLQSLLLVSQTLSHKVGSRSVVLNGALTRLGQFDDLRSYEGEFDQITIGWECHPTEDAQMAIIEKMRFPGSIMVYGRRMDSIKEITCKLAFDTNPGSPERDLYQLQPQLFLFTMSLLARDEDKTDRRYELTISRNLAGNTKITNLKIEEPNDEIARASLEYDIVLDEDSLAELREELVTAEPVGCVLRHFLPDRLSIRVNTVEEIARQIQLALIDDAPRHRRAMFLDRELAIPEDLLTKLQMKLGDKYGILFEKQSALFETGSGMPVAEWVDRTRKLVPDKRRELRRALAEWPELRETIASTLRSQRKAGEPEYQLLTYRPPVDLMNASAYLNLLFSNSVKYLGPLRDDPKPLYPLAAHADPTDVGLRGEMTAAVLNLHRQRLIRFIPSAAFAKTPLDPSSVPRSLEAAVTDWLKYLGVAETACSVDKGKLGHELKVSLSEGGPNHDLTHVGVGVSQVLPILVMSLLADRDTTLIFEQPELHLHPRVQTRLADFFLSIVLAGKQCLIETHSEYLINRLRYRAASERDDNRVTKNLKVYFVEKDDGLSSFREVKMNEYGAILDWPEGFFDQSPQEAEAILRAAMRKRRSEKGGGASIE